MIKITECPRDAMQGIKTFIPTEVKVHYLNLLLKVGFDRLDFGSFVSPKYTPQMQDTADVVDLLETEGNSTTLLAIIANLRGAQDAVQFEKIGILGFPFSISESFQIRNTNSSREQSLKIVEEVSTLCSKNNKIPLVYLSMGFGNPYGDAWSLDLVADYTEKLIKLGIHEIMLSDTTGESDPEKIRQLFPFLKNSFPTISLGLHLHSAPDDTDGKLHAALDVGCTRFDAALRGFGGCPMAKDTLVGNIATERLITLLDERKIPHQLNKEAWNNAMAYSQQVFSN